MRKVKIEFREFLEKRQRFLEKSRGLKLGNRDWSAPSEAQIRNEEYLLAKKAEIHEFRKAFDWTELKQREIRYVQNRNEKQKARDSKDVV
jgi:hypothetical protein